MIEVIKVKDYAAGQNKAHDILKKLVDRKTLLALSGGTSVDYKKMLVEPCDIMPGAICVVDERYGKPFHKDSNELLLTNQGIKSFADKNCIERYKILADLPFEETGLKYAKVIKELFSRFKKKTGVLGVGTNLHTAGIFPYSVAVHSLAFAVSERVEDKFPERITITLKALKEFTDFVILMFGHAKREALEIMLNAHENDTEKYPAVFYRQSGIKTYIITDIDLINLKI